MDRSRTPPLRNTNNSRAAVGTTPLSDILRQARTRRRTQSAQTNRGRSRISSPVTIGRSLTSEEDPQVSSIKLETEEIALVNACLKETGECDSASEIAAYLETLETMVTQRAKQCERFVPSLKAHVANICVVASLRAAPASL